MDAIVGNIPVGGELGLTPNAENYIDIYDLFTKEMPTKKAEAIAKYNPTLIGLLNKFAGTTQLTADSYRWSEIERSRTFYNDCIVTTVGTGVNAAFTLTRAAGAAMILQKYQHIQLHVGGNKSGVFVVSEINASKTSATIVTHDVTTTLAESGIFTAAGSPHASVTLLSQGIQTGKGAKGDAFSGGKKIPYNVYSVVPNVNWSYYSENGSEVSNISWITVNGQPRWFMTEIDMTREELFETEEIKGLEGTMAVTGSGIDTLRGSDSTYSAGTKGAFQQVRERGATTAGEISGLADIESMIRYWDKYEGAGANLVMCSRNQELALDKIGRSFNNGAADEEFVGNYSNAERRKILDLGFSGFNHGGFRINYQAWRYLTEATYRGADGLNTASKINYFSIPIGMTPVGDGLHADLDTPSRILPQHYMTKVVKREYESRVVGGTWNAHTNHDDNFSVSFKSESCIALAAAEKFILSEGPGE